MNLLKTARVLLISAILTTTLWAQDQGRDFHWTGKLGADQVVEIKNINGLIEAQAGSGDAVQVTAEKSGPKAEQVNIQVVPHNDGVTICAIYPSGLFGGSSGPCEPGSRWHSSNVHSDNTKVHFLVRMPRNLRFLAQNVNGDIRAEDLGRFVRVSTVNGSIRIATMPGLK
jgi:hypothetical protein